MSLKHNTSHPSHNQFTRLSNDVLDSIAVIAYAYLDSILNITNSRSHFRVEVTGGVHDLYNNSTLSIRVEYGPTKEGDGADKIRAKIERYTFHHFVGRVAVEQKLWDNLVEEIVVRNSHGIWKHLDDAGILGIKVILDEVTTITTDSSKKHILSMITKHSTTI